MYKVSLNLANGKPITIYFNNNLVVHLDEDYHTQKPQIRVMDGLHNNGGWIVKESYEEVIKKIDNAIVFKKI
jgi:uncharacterized protein YlzI (FlbEa/FlbD family)